jgi:ubiquitin conjugation factor E4 B
MVSILRVFVDAERLGTSNQFYEKFVVRAKIMILIENINKGYGHLFEENLKEYTEKYPDESKKMVNNLLNDLIYLNDECIENLKVIKNYQDLLDDKERYSKMSLENKRFEERRFKEKDKLVRPQIKLFNGSLKFLVCICKILQNFLIKNDFISQLAGYLNYSLNIFGSPLTYELKLKNISEYNFNPHFILGSILSTYSAFYDKFHFIEGVIKDERSYKFSNFDRAKNLVANNKSITINEKDFENYIKFVDNLRREEKIIKRKEISYDDAPQEFIDALTFNIMTDPVKLPKSQVILDRKTIETHLLSDQTYPFNREPLTKEMLIPCPLLKAKIEEYMRNKKNEKLKEL